MIINRTSINYFIIFSGIIFFIIKWYQPFLIFKENIDVKIIFESITDGYKYFPIFKSFVDLNLSNSYDSSLSDLNNITVPAGSFYIHSILYFFLKSWSFIVLELIFIIFFLGIFYKISRLLGFKRIESFLISIFLYNLPIFLDLISLSNVSYLSVINFDLYNLRFPRPLVTNLFFYCFIAMTLNILIKGELVKRKNFIILGVISGLSFTSFFYHFLLEQITLFVCVLYIYKKNFFKYLIKNYVSIIFFFISFLIISSPLLLNFNLAEKDFLERMGALDLDLEKKKILIKYSLSKFLDIKFILLIIISIILYFFINKPKYKNLLSKNKLFLFLLWSSIISPIIFILFSPSYFSHFFFFNNLTIITFFLLIFFTLLKLIQRFFIDKVSNKIFNFISVFLVAIIFFSHFFVIKKNYFSNQINNEKFKIRSEFNKIVNIINTGNFELKESTLLTFDNKIMVWFMLNDIQNLKIINGLFVPRKNKMIEDDLIGSFKYLNLSGENLKSFIMNKKKGWRYRNDNIMNLFWGRYQANSLTTFNDSDDFDKPILEFIKNSSPIMSQQMIMPNFEIDRFIEKFENYNQDYSDPNLIILNKKDPDLKKSIVDHKIFCKVFDGDQYVFYRKRNNDNKCD